MANWWTHEAPPLPFGQLPQPVGGERTAGPSPTCWRSARRALGAFAAVLLLSPTTEAATKPDRKAFAASVCTAIDKAAAANDLDRVFFTRLLWKESLFDPNAVSPKGAQGLAQFMPDTAERRNLSDPFDPLAAIGASASFLSDLKKDFGNLGLAAAAYNAGEARVARWLAGTSATLPDETEDYVAYITGKIADEWKDKAASFAMPALGKAGDFASQCIALASREVNPTSGVKRGKSQPWGVLLAADFNEGRALALFKRLKLRFPQVLDGAQPFVMRKKNLSRGTRKMAFVMVGTKTREAAQELCTKYTTAGLPCVVRKNG
jgi:Transglycosylase SLT domain